MHQNASDHAWVDEVWGDYLLFWAGGAVGMALLVASGAQTAVGSSHGRIGVSREHLVHARASSRLVAHAAMNTTVMYST